MLRIADTGLGMDRDTLSHMFEPFFTTKPIGEGTGLGLSTVHGIIRQSNGSIRVESAPGRGATFTIYLPHAESAGNGPPAETARPAAAPSQGTVLVVDDEPDVRAMISRTLREEGYRVWEAGTADEALAAMPRHGVPLDLLVTDVVMPGMGGKELANQLRKLYPAVGVLFTSGHPDHVVYQHGLLERGQPFLQKPYSPDILVARMRQLLEAARLDA
jgi:CheY-like chemotaxis protein